jgi:hypothetical protein
MLAGISADVAIVTLRGGAMGLIASATMPNTVTDVTAP